MGKLSLLFIILLTFVRLERAGGILEEVDRECAGSLECLDRSDCASFQEKSDRLKTLESGSEERNDLLNELKSLVCNKNKQRVCCVTDACLRDLLPDPDQCGRQSEDLQRGRDARYRPPSE